MDTMHAFTRFVARQAEDAVKRDLELYHETCGTHVTDIEPDDNLAEWAGVALEHTEKCPVTSGWSEAGPAYPGGQQRNVNVPGFWALIGPDTHGGYGWIIISSTDGDWDLGHVEDEEAAMIAVSVWEKGHQPGGPAAYGEEFSRVE